MVTYPQTLIEEFIDFKKYMKQALASSNKSK